MRLRAKRAKGETEFAWRFRLWNSALRNTANEMQNQVNDLKRRVERLEIELSAFRDGVRFCADRHDGPVGYVHVPEPDGR